MSTSAEIHRRFFPDARPIVRAVAVHARREMAAGVAALQETKRRQQKAQRILRAIEKALEPMPVDAPFPSMLEIAREVARKHGFKSWRELTVHRRAKEYVIPRQEAMWRCYKETGQSLPTIGRFFGGFDHTTVIHACRAHEARMAACNLLEEVV